jgi:hypothetical protein
MPDGQAQGHLHPFHAGANPAKARAVCPEVPEPVTLTALFFLAYWTGRAAAAARDQLTALLSVRERVLGAEHPHTLSTRYRLARWTGRAGSVISSSRCCPSANGCWIPGHPDTMATRYELAYWTAQR